MILIICAMAQERDAFISLMKDVKKTKIDKIKYHGEEFENTCFQGFLGNKEVCIIRCGVGKVNASIVTTLAIKKFKPELVINVGCAGSLNENVHVGDCIIATKAADWEVEVPGWDRSIESDKISFPCDERFYKLANQVKTDYKVVSGYIVSSDQFIYKKSQVNTIKKYFKDALAGEMEGSAIANVCYAFDVKCAIIRSISDETLVNGSYKEFDFNLEKACTNAAKLCEMILEKY